MLFSIITPSYNSSKYLKRCIESVIKQKFKSWEMIIIDDGSTDDSLLIANQYQNIDDRIKVFTNKVNKGYVFTNNRLFELAHYDYVIPLDSDNWFGSNAFLSIASNVINAHNPDMVQFPLLCRKENSGEVINIYPAINEPIIYNDYSLICDGIRASKIYTGSHGGKIIKKALVKGIQFFGNPTGSDSRFVSCLLSRCNCVYCLASPYYNVEIREDGVSQQKRPTDFSINWIKNEMQLFPLYLKEFNRGKKSFPQIKTIDLYSLCVLSSPYNSELTKIGKDIYKSKKLFVTDYGVIYLFVLLKCPRIYRFLKRKTS